MNETLGKALLHLGIDKSALQKGLAEAKTETAGAAGGMQSLLGAFSVTSAASFAGIALSVKKVAGAYGEQEAAEIRFQTALRKTGKFAEDAKQGFFSFASEMERLTAIDDTLIIAMGGLLLNLGVLPADLQRAARAGADLSAALDIDLRSAMMLVGKAAAGNVELFGRYGVKFDEAKVSAGGFGYVLGELERRFGGQAQANAEGYAKSLTAIANAFGNLLEQIGKPFALGLTQGKDPITGFLDMLRKGLAGVEEESRKAGESFGRLVVGVLDPKAAGIAKALNALSEELENSKPWEAHTRQVRLGAEVQEAYNALIKSEREELSNLLREKGIASFVVAGEERQKKLLTEAVKRSKEAIAQEAEELRKIIGPAASARFESEQGERALRREFAMRGIVSAGLHENVMEMDNVREGLYALGLQMKSTNQDFEGTAEMVGNFVLETDSAAQRFAEGWTDAFDKAERAAFDWQGAGERAFRGVQGALSAGFSDAIFASARGKFDELADAVDNFGKRVLRALADIAADKIAKEVLAGASAIAGPILSAAKGLFGLAEGALVQKPTVALLGEAGPELVIPLDAAGSFIRSAIVEAVKTAAFEEAATAAAMSELGTAASAAGIGDVTAAAAGASAASVAGVVMSAALFAFLEAANQGAGTRAIGAALLGRGAQQGLIPKALGGLGLSAFRERSKDPWDAALDALAQERRAFHEMFERGFGPVRELTEMGLTSYERFKEALAGTGLGVGYPEAIAALDFSGGAAGGLAAAILEGLPKHAAWAGEEAARLFAALDRSGDAEGRFITGPSLRLVGEGGPEHVLSVDSEPSVRALREGLRPIVREVFEDLHADNEIEFLVHEWNNREWNKPYSESDVS
ncbi:MAG: hypothetical protein AAB368_03475 [bacterium]